MGEMHIILRSEMEANVNFQSIVQQGWGIK
jgi:hypothetical protein